MEEVRSNPTADNSSNHSPSNHQRRASAVSVKKLPASPCPVYTTPVSLASEGIIGSHDELGVSAFPDGESIFSWIGTMEGGKGTLYEGLPYKLSFRFPNQKS